MHIKDSNTAIQEVENKDITIDIADLLRVIIIPASKGPAVVAKHSAKVWPVAIAVYAIVKGFFVLCFYHGINQAILRAFVDFGNSIANGLKNMSEEMLGFIVNTVLFNVAKIPFIGESISKAANNYLSDYLTLLATGISTETNDLLYNLYP
ncbi:MAG: hypothetical protein K6A23_15450, partial [Butyrivibrio sp.]|nr:hypothetical protein [Butyrivibrio sp.]